MARDENGQIVINNTGNTDLIFDNAVATVIMWSADDSFYIKHDGDALVSHFLHPQDSPITYGVPCKKIGMRAQNQVSAVVMYLAVYRIQGEADSDPDVIRGGVDV